MNASTDKKPLWIAPWGFSEGFVISLGLLIIALFLELSVPLSRLPKPNFPTNALLLAACAISIVVFKLWAGKTSLFLWFASPRAAFPSISLFLFVVILMGIFPQQTHGSGIPGALFNILNSWLFLIPLLFLLIALGSATVNRMHPFTVKNAVFTLNHLGIWLCLTAGILGNSDRIEATLKVNRNDIVWYGTTSNGNIIELPIAIELEKFTAEFYQPRIVLAGEKIITADSDYNLTAKPEIEIDNLIVRVKRYLPKAYATDSLFIDARGIPFAGPAVEVGITDTKKQTVATGWISNATRITAERIIRIPDGRALRLLSPEPKYFGSTVKVYAKASNSVQQGIVEVNHPISADGWWIYQYSYDNLAGSDSPYSTFKAIYDPWLPLVYLGFFMILAGSIGLLVVYPVKK